MLSGRLLRIICLFGPIMALTGCLNCRYFSCPSDNVYLLADYEDAVEHWTEHDEVHRNLIILANGYCLYRGWEVRQAYIQTVRNKMNPKPEIMERIELRETNVLKTSHEFLLGLYTHNPDWNRLTGIDPVWNITLQADGIQSVRPVMVEKIQIPREEADLYLSTLTDWGETYRVRFPLVDSLGNTIITRDTRKFTVKCESMVGSLVFTWKLRPVPGRLCQ